MKIPVAIPDITEDDVTKVTECVKSGWVSGISPYVEEFGQKFADFCGVAHGVPTGSGTTSLHLSVAALGLGPGDEVIVPTFTMAASVNALLYEGVKPVFVDSDPDTWCMDPGKIRDVITPQTRAIMPVHIYGHPCQMNALVDLAFEHELLIIEDAAEAHGAEFKRKKMGWFGAVSSFSFYANKIITTGEGGIMVTDDYEIAERAKWLRAHAFGRDGKHYWHEDVGYGFRMSGMQAALGISQLDRIDYYIEKRKLDAWIYMNELRTLETDGKVTFPVQEEGCSNVYWMFSLLLEEDFPLSRDELIAELAKEGIETRTFFYPLHLMPPYATEEYFPVAEDISRRGINLPSGNALTRAQIMRVCEAVWELAG